MDNKRLIAMRCLRDIRKAMYETTDMFGCKTLCIRKSEFLEIVDKYNESVEGKCKDNG